MRLVSTLLYLSCFLHVSAIKRVLVFFLKVKAWKQGCSTYNIHWSMICSETSYRVYHTTIQCYILSQLMDHARNLEAVAVNYHPLVLMAVCSEGGERGEDGDRPHACYS